MAAVGSDLESVLVGERELWQEGPPHELFKQMRGKCPIHWTERITEFPQRPATGSVTTAEDIQPVSRDWKTYSSETGVTAVSQVFPLELTRAMFIGMDPPKHDRLKALFQPASRRSGSPTTRMRSGRSWCACSTVSPAATPATSSTTSPSRSSSRVIGSFMGIPAEDDAIWARLMNSTLGAGDVDLNPEGVEGRDAAGHPRDLRALPQADRGGARSTRPTI